MNPDGSSQLRKGKATTPELACLRTAVDNLTLKQGFLHLRPVNLGRWNFQEVVDNLMIDYTLELGMRPVIRKADRMLNRLLQRVEME